jgi:hypothetical protein
MIKTGPTSKSSRSCGWRKSHQNSFAATAPTLPS